MTPSTPAGQIYLFGKKGKTRGIEPSAKHRFLAVNHLDASFTASPAASGTAAYLRTKKALYRIEDQSQQGP